MADPTPDVIDRLARIETKLDNYTNLSSRVDRLERFMWLALGISCASGASNFAKFIG